MSRPCSVCVHAELESINQALVERKIPVRTLARNHGVSRDALMRHNEAHVPATLAKAAKAHEAARGDGLLAQVRQLVADARRYQAAAEAAGDARLALQTIREQGRVLELLGKVTGELAQGGGTTVNVGVAVNQAPQDIDSYSDQDLEEHVADIQRELDERRARRALPVEGTAVPELSGAYAPGPIPELSGPYVSANPAPAIPPIVRPVEKAQAMFSNGARLDRGRGGTP